MFKSSLLVSVITALVLFVLLTGGVRVPFVQPSPPSPQGNKSVVDLVLLSMDGKRQPLRLNMSTMTSPSDLVEYVATLLGVRAPHCLDLAVGIISITWSTELVSVLEDGASLTVIHSDPVAAMIADLDEVSDLLLGAMVDTYDDSTPESLNNTYFIVSEERNVQWVRDEIMAKELEGTLSWGVCKRVLPAIAHVKQTYKDYILGMYQAVGARRRADDPKTLSDISPVGHDDDHHETTSFSDSPTQSLEDYLRTALARVCDELGVVSSTEMEHHDDFSMHGDPFEEQGALVDPGDALERAIQGAITERIERAAAVEEDQRWRQMLAQWLDRDVREAVRSV